MTTRRRRYRAAGVKAARLTNKQLSSELAALGPVSAETLNSLLPRKRDKQAFIALMKQVELEADMDQNLAYLKDNLQTAGKAVFKMLKVFV